MQNLLCQIFRETTVSSTCSILFYCCLQLHKYCKSGYLHHINVFFYNATNAINFVRLLLMGVCVALVTIAMFKLTQCKEGPFEVQEVYM